MSQPARAGDEAGGAGNVDEVDDVDEIDEAQRRFVEGLVARGEVASADAGPLPPNVTHVAEDEHDGVARAVRRRRFSAR
ncbi:hypothetical protein [Frankia sp. CiP3]|uniref:hypothetical protein n=1 Tax=Frankia sp. CiP3 TaxID=2880971 RepID=UPI001EF6ABF2|nr:hypothetical protein [Frankia sp. CiP3]